MRNIKIYNIIGIIIILIGILSNDNSNDIHCTDIAMCAILSKKMVVRYIQITPELIDSISYIESRHTPNAIGDGGKAYGSLQIHKIAVDDHNRLYGTKYTHNDMFTDSIARIVCEGLLNYGISLYYNKHCKYPATEDLLRMWNGGIYTGYKKDATLVYVEKFNQLKLTDDNWI
jgi:hypothetical protein